MENRIDQLRKQYGSYGAVAASLGVTSRTLLNYRKRNGKLPRRVQLMLDAISFRAPQANASRLDGESTVSETPTLGN